MNRASFHLVETLDEPLDTERFLASFPARESSVFVLDGGGAQSNPRLDDFAFLGAEPIASFVAHRIRDERGAILRDERGRALGRVAIHRQGETTVRENVNPWDELSRFYEEHALPTSFFQPSPIPFRAGFVGYLGYEAGQFLEKLPCENRPSSGLPDIALSLYRWLIAKERRTGQCHLSVIGEGESEAEARKDAERIRDEVLAKLRKGRENAISSSETPLPPKRGNGLGDGGSYSLVDRDAYLERIRIVKEHIDCGDAFEICLTKAHKAPFSLSDSRALYTMLRSRNPAPFAGYWESADFAIVSSSPERFVSLDAEGWAESRPIKGTRPRGETKELDERLARELATCEKDRAENAMIVDLTRNDFGRVCRFGSVTVPELFAVEGYATVHQLVSTIRGQLLPDKSAIDLVRACFPPGSMTGAPKIEAMRILEGLEVVERGVYAGAFGWLDLGGAMDLSVVIRTLVLANGEATFSVGGAIVADSDPEGEHEEAELKARALVRALETFAKGGA